MIPSRDLMLGGVHIPYTMGLLGHSDGEVVLHAIIDALLGAASMGDIGTFFPDNDVQYKDADSRSLAAFIREKLIEKKWEIINIDVTIHAEAPRLEMFKGQIKRTIADVFGVSFEVVNIKAKTNEGLGEIGAGQAIAATAAALLRRREKRTL